MTNDDFVSKFCACIGDLWERWAQREWNEANQRIVWEIVRYSDVSVVCDCLRQQRFADPDAIKPNWKQLRSDLKARRGEGKGQTTEDAESDARAKDETRRFNDWMRGRSKANLTMLRDAMLSECPRLRGAFGLMRIITDDRSACRILMMWEKNSLDRFFEKFRGPAPEVVRQPSLLDQLDKPNGYRGERAFPPPATKHAVLSEYIRHEAKLVEPEPEPTAEPEPLQLQPAGAVPEDIDYPVDDILF